jgi:hypothetical protein
MRHHQSEKSREITKALNFSNYIQSFRDYDALVGLLLESNHPKTIDHR